MSDYDAVIMFDPDEIIFVPTQKCNLKCSHCYVPNQPVDLSFEKACAFLCEAVKDGIDRVGFSGGEPFLNVDFVLALVKKAVSLDCIFDRIMTNGIWWSDKTELTGILQALCDTGYDGHIAISFDVYHNQDEHKVADFIETAYSVWQNRDCIEIVSVLDSVHPENNEKTFQKFSKLAALLKAEVQSDEIERVECLQFTDKMDTFFIDDREFDILPVSYIDYTHENILEPEYWKSKKWFIEDFCESTGNVYYVHANGDVAVCCGYANECAGLIMGNINTMSYVVIQEKAFESCKTGFLKTVYCDGLLNTAQKLESADSPLPGKTNNNCLFCRYLLNH